MYRTKFEKKKFIQINIIEWKVKIKYVQHIDRCKKKSL